MAAEPFSIGAVLAEYAVGKLADAGIFATMRGWLKWRERGAFKRAFNTAGNKTRGEYPEVSAELFNAASAQRLASTIRALARNPAERPPVHELRDMFVSENFPGKTGDDLVAALRARYRREPQEVHDAIACFLNEAIKAFAAEEVLRQHWRDQTQRQTQEASEEARDAAERAAAQTEVLPALETIRPLATERLRDRITTTWRRRGFPGSDVGEDAARLETEVLAGEFAVAERAARIDALLLCAQFYARAKKAKEAHAAIARARGLGSVPADPVRDAWIAHADGDQARAIGIVSAYDTPLSVTTQLALIHADGGPQVVTKAWEDRGLGPADVSGGGLHLVVNCYMATQRNEEALAIADQVQQMHFDDAPFLHATIALANLIAVVDISAKKAMGAAVLPIDPRGLVVNVRPDRDGRLQNASREFRAAKLDARKLETPDVADLYEEREIWAGLEHPTLNAAAKRDLATLMTEEASALRLVSLAKAYGVPFDAKGIDEAVKRAGRLRRLTLQEIRAILVLSDNPRELLELATTRKQDVADALGDAGAALLTIECLIKTGQLPAAREEYDKVAADLPGDERIRMKTMLDDAAGEDTLPALIEHFKQTNDLRELEAIVETAAEKERWGEGQTYAKLLWERTGEPRHLTNYCLMLERLGRARAAWSELDKAWASIQPSAGLLRARATLGFAVRELRAARAALASLRGLGLLSGRDVRLSAQVEIESGNWEALVDVVRDVAERQDIGDADLVGWCAKLAVLLDRPVEANRLVERLVAMAPDDPHAMLTAYVVRVKLGQDDDEVSAGWLQRAAAHSGENGPVTQKSFGELLTLIPAWSERNTAISREVLEGRLPLFLAARALNTNLTDLTLGAAHRARAESDPRSRPFVSAFFGARAPTVLPQVSSLALDLTSLFALDVAGCLDLTIATYVVEVPAWTLASLLMASDQVKFHQPSRVTAAKELIDLHQRGLLRIHAQKGNREELTRSLGPDFSGLIEQAETVSGWVVRPAPMHHVGSAMEIEVDLPALSGRVVDTMAVTAALLAEGAITERKSQEVQPVLARLDRGWPNAVALDLSAPFFLDGVAVDYLQGRGLLRPFCESAQVWAEASVVDEAKAILEHENTGRLVSESIERIRTLLAAGLESERVKVAASVSVDDDEEDETEVWQPDPTRQIVSGAISADLVVIDDRAINRYVHVERAGGGSVPIITSLDVIDALHRQNVMPDAEWRSARHRLREAGYAFVPLLPQEITYWVMQSRRRDNGELVESVELRTVRESIERVIMLGSRPLPTERPVFMSWRLALLAAIRKVWSEVADDSLAESMANWCLSLIPDPRDTVHLCEASPSDAVIDAELAENAVFASLAIVSELEGRDVLVAKWADESVVKPLRDRRPAAFELAVAGVMRVVTRDEPEGTSNGAA